MTSMPADDRSQVMPAVEWLEASSPVGYSEAVDFMRARGDAIARGTAAELIWLLEHAPVYTAGTSTDPRHLPAGTDITIIPAERGGSLTYHGPGQRIAYTLLDVRQRSGGDVRAFVELLERWVIAALNRLGVDAFVAAGRPGVWVEDASALKGQSKVAALGLRVRNGVSRHGVSINVDPDLEAFSRIIPCGLEGFGVTSLARLGKPASLQAVDAALKASFQEIVETQPAGGLRPSPI